MKNYQKKFAEWAKVASEVQKGTRIELLKSGAIHWVYAGVNIGSEEDGKGAHFTRPALVLKSYGDKLVLIAFTTSQKKTGQYYCPIMVSGSVVYVILNQFRIVDRLRIRDYIDEISEHDLKKIRSAVANLIM